MRIVSVSRRLVASILVIGLLSVALTLVCSDGAHFAGSMTDACAIMSHTDGVSAVVGSDSSESLVSQLFVVVAAFSLFIAMFGASARLVPLSVSPGIPPDPLHGRLRLAAQRLARGEVSPAEYDEIRRVLQG